MMMNIEQISILAGKDARDYTTEEKHLVELLTRQRVVRPLITVGMGSAGIVAGAEKTMKAIESYLQERGLEADVCGTGTIGLIAAEPIVGVQLPGRNRLLFSNVTEEDIPALMDDVFHHTLPESLLLAQLRNHGSDPWKKVPYLDELPFFSMQTRRILQYCGIIDPMSIEEYIANNGYKAFLSCIRFKTYREICAIVESSGLRGRSGSGFPAGRKWQVANATPSDQKYLICNAEESDPGAFMDRTLMEGNPHQVIEGIAIASYAIGATKAMIYIRSEYTNAILKLENAISQVRELGLIGHNIFQSGYNLDISIRKGPGAFVCGEETALIASLEGKRGMPRSKPPFPAESGYHGKPTVINNVETLSNVPFIVSSGAGEFRKTGLPENPGTKVFSISGRVRFPGLIEVPMGTSLKDIVTKIAGGVPEEGILKAVHIGGPSGCMIPEKETDLPLDYDRMKEKGYSLGAGGILVLDEKSCIIDMVRYFMDFSQKQSCGKCIPCREGTKRMSEILDGISRKPVDENSHTTLERFKGVMQLESLAGVMKDTSLCGLGQTAPNPVLTSLKHFRNEYEEHIFDRACRANVCTELRTFYIDVGLCTGCGICEKKCPAEAIIGAQRHPYFIVANKCTGCGICYETCKFSAVYFN
ncbi:MAG: NADH-ubiquinone oxidoreductase-F iron-sulfur binding region domain-containing protein [Bacteroidota bacterium]